VGSSGNGQYTIDLHRVEKMYRGKVHALRGVEMQVHPGEVFGLLGPNGAGKSTLVKIMMTVVRPTRAGGTILGHPIGHKATLGRIGYLPEHHKLPAYLTGRQVLEHFAALARVGRRDRRTRAAELLEVVGMADWAKKKVGAYSKGMQQRIGLAQALMNDPTLVVLDEPTDGVDPVGRREIRDVLIRLRDEGRTIFLNSHLLSELEMVCDRVAILVQGKVVMQGTLDELTAHSRRYEVVIEGAAPPWAEADESIVTRDQGPERTLLILQGTEPGPVQPTLDRLRAEERVICSLQPVRENLEDLFMRAVRDPATGKVLKPGAGSDRPAPPGAEVAQ
jgi:ABC-2 type transport system ATP-binding protein